MKETDQMTKWQERARRCLAGGVSSHFRAADPVVFSHGRGSRIWDVDGNEYIDYTLSQGPLIHGDRKSTRLNSSHIQKSRMPSSA